MILDQPMFIVSPPRCGTSLLYRAIGDHPQVGYFNRANRKFPEHPRLARFLTRVGLYKDTKRESRAIWDRFLTTRRDGLTAADATPEITRWYEENIGAMLAARGASRFVGKLPAFSMRIPWLDAAFPHGIFIRILRDWRAVVGSTAAKGRDDFAGRAFGVKPKGWKDHVDEGLEMWAAWQYVRVNEILDAQSARLPNRFVDLWYEDLCLHPAETVSRIYDLCGLEQSEEAVAAIVAQARPPSEKWKQHLSADVLRKIVERHGIAITRFEYPPGE